MTAFEPTSGQDRQAPLDPPNPQGGLGGSSRPRGLLSHAKQSAGAEGNTPPPASANPAPTVTPNQQNKPRNSLLGFGAQAQQPMMSGQQMGPQPAYPQGPFPPNQPMPQAPAPGQGMPLMRQPGPGPQGPFPPNQSGLQGSQPWGAPPNQQVPPQPPMSGQPWPQQPAQISPALQPNMRMPAQPPAQPVPAGSQPQRMEVINGQLILHRSEHFYVRTVYRPGYQPSVNPLRKPSGMTQQMPKVLPRPKQPRRNKPPAITVFENEKKVRKFPVPRWLEATIVIVGLVISLASHLYNVFNYPRYEMDEGTYMFSAWSILHGKLMPYAYGYGHPPFAWMQIAAAIPLMGGFFTFGNAINTGRLLMLFFAVASSLLVYLVVRRLGGSRSAGLLAMVIFSLSPLAITYQRQVLLDNIGVFWMMLALYCLVSSESRLLRIVLSAVFFGLAVLSKEVFALFLPCMIYGVWLHVTEFQRKFALVTFIYVSVALISMWVLMAFLKGEIFPPGWFGDQRERLSFLGVFIGQVKRGSNEGSFASSWEIWSKGDVVLLAFSIGASVFNLVMGWKNRKQLFLGLLSVSFWALLLRPNGVVLSFYFIPLIPMAALNAAFAINTIMKWIGQAVRFDLVRAILVVMVIAALIPYDILTTFRLLSLTVTPVQNQALVWVRNHIPRDDFVVINAPQYTDMHAAGGLGVGEGAVFTHAEVYQNVATDPEIFNKHLHKDWRGIKYFIADSEMRIFITGNPQGKPGERPNKQNNFACGQEPKIDGHILQTAFDHSVLVANFEYNPPDVSVDQWYDIKIYQVMQDEQESAQAIPPLPGDSQCRVTTTAAIAPSHTDTG
ncbi:MAG: phospholipid carrier-dependent glycosyltransferase [Chloroflexi bacterium]|nr:MAG: phospholipid carrier-dependent glycosyltransferase [Chloroflexota bacterium]